MNGQKYYQIRRLYMCGVQSKSFRTCKFQKIFDFDVQNVEITNSIDFPYFANDSRKICKNSFQKDHLLIYDMYEKTNGALSLFYNF